MHCGVHIVPISSSLVAPVAPVAVGRGRREVVGRIGDLTPPASTSLVGHQDALGFDLHAVHDLDNCERRHSSNQHTQTL